jgi:hypothetical protein
VSGVSDDPVAIETVRDALAAADTTGEGVPSYKDLARAVLEAIEPLTRQREAKAWDKGQQAGFRFYRERVPFAERDRNPYRGQA